MASQDTFTSSQNPFVERAEAIAKDVLRRHAADVDEKGRFPYEGIDALAGAGLLGLFASRVGRDGGSMRLFARTTECLARECSSTAMVFVMHVAATQAIKASTTFGRKAEILTAISDGRHLTTLAFSERGSRSHFWAPVSQLAPSDGAFEVSADKSWVTAAGHADSYVTSAQQPGAGSPLESTLFFVAREMPNVRVEEGFDGLGLRGNDSRPVKLSAANVSKDDLLTPQGAGAAAMMQVVLPWFNVGTAAMANGLCRAALDSATAHAQRTEFQNTHSGLRDLPVIRARLADMRLRTEMAGALLDQTLGEIEHGSPSAPMFVLLTRLASIEAAVDVTDLAMKACGGAAFSRYLNIERLFRDARAGWVMAPTADHLRDFIGREQTGLPLL